MERSREDAEPAYGRFYSWPRLLSFTLAMILIEFVDTTLTVGISIGTLERDSEVGLTLAVFLVWLVYNLKLRPRHVFLLLWLNIFIVRYASNMLEGYFYTTIYTSYSSFLYELGVAFLISFLIALAAGFVLLHPEFNDSLWERSRDMLSRRSTRDWVARIIAASPLYFLVYFAFGTAVSPFVYSYYQDPSLGLRIPPFTVMIPLELARGLIYTVALVPLTIAIGTGKWYVFIAASMMLFIPGSLVPLIEAPLPVQILPYHGAELLADSLVYGLVLTWLFTPPARALTGSKTAKA